MLRLTRSKVDSDQVVQETEAPFTSLDRETRDTTTVSQNEAGTDRSMVDKDRYLGGVPYPRYVECFSVEPGSMTDLFYMYCMVR